MHPTAVLKGAALRSTEQALQRATTAAAARGATALPALVVGESVLDGARAVAEASSLLEGAAR
jgi:hypothetical protein